MANAARLPFFVSVKARLLSSSDRRRRENPTSRQKWRACAAAKSSAPMRFRFTAASICSPRNQKRHLLERCRIILIGARAADGGDERGEVPRAGAEGDRRDSRARQAGVRCRRQRHVYQGADARLVAAAAGRSRTCASGSSFSAGELLRQLEELDPETARDRSIARTNTASSALWKFAC